MMSVRGFLDGTAYDVTLTGDPGTPVHGSARVRVLVGEAVAAGRHVLAGPTGPRLRVDPADPMSIVQLLAEVGTVREVTGAPEGPAAPRDAGVIH